MIAEVARFKKEQKKIPKQLCLGILGGELGTDTTPFNTIIGKHF